jgi:hypothetical protein
MLLEPRRMLFLGIPPGTAAVHTSTFFDAFNVDDFQLIAPGNAKTLLLIPCLGANKPQFL